jgi:hypothetical protein
MRLIVGHESSGIVRDAFIARGHQAVSCDLLPTERPGPHIQGDIFDALNSQTWDAMIVHPDCTYLCSSGLHWNRRVPGRAELTEKALAHVRRLLEYMERIGKGGLENPVGRIGTRIEKATQYIQPYQFGEDASKKTGLWLRGLPKLAPTSYFPPRIVEDGPYAGRERWSNQTDSGQNRLGPGEDRWKDRSRTYQGIADAMAQQWG